MNRGNAGVILHIAPGSRGLRSNRTGDLQVIVDGPTPTPPPSSSPTPPGSRRILRGVRLSRMQRHPSLPGPPSVSLASRAWFNENLESRFTFLPDHRLHRDARDRDAHQHGDRPGARDRDPEQIW